jgi:hypothetical protein
MRRDETTDLLAAANLRSNTKYYAVDLRFRIADEMLPFCLQRETALLKLILTYSTLFIIFKLARVDC